MHLTRLGEVSLNTLTRVLKVVSETLLFIGIISRIFSFRLLAGILPLVALMQTAMYVLDLST